MKAKHFRIFLGLSLIAAFTTQPNTASQDLIGHENLRRILHQPLYPVSSSPPSPPPPANTEIPSPDHPFSPEVPTGPTPPDQAQSSPPAAANGTAVPNPVATPAQPTKPTKKLAIAISVGIVTLGMLSALGFYLFKHRMKRPDESRKLLGGNSQRVNEELQLPPSNLLYIGTVEPTAHISVTETNPATANGSPHRKVSSVKTSDRYRPSPELQPLPPLSKPPPPPAMNSPPPMSSSDEESHDTAFYTPQGSSVSNDEGYSTPISRQSQQSNNTSLVRQSSAEPHVYSSVPHSKRTSPKSRLSASSPDVRSAIIPSAKHPPPSPPSPPLPPEESQLTVSTYAPKLPNFSSPPPSPDMARLQLISNQDQETSNAPLPSPPPPPPPPPLFSTPRKVGSSEKNIPATALRQPILPKSWSSNPNTTIVEKKGPEEEFNEGTRSSERHDDDDDEMAGLKPKLKPLHWDKVRATSDRATVWDQLKSSSFELNEDMMESLFGCSSGNSVPKEATMKSFIPPVEQENRVLDPKKSQNIAILLRALNVTRDEVSEALLDGNQEALGPELLETLVKMAPTKEEEIKLRNYTGETSRLGSAERFLKAILDVPFAFKRVETMLYRANFDAELNYLRNSFQTLEEASQELKSSRLFLKLLEAVLRTGNRMNVGTYRGDATAFKLDTLLKLVDIKGIDGKTTLLHFVVQEIIRSDSQRSSSEAANESLAHKTNPKAIEDDFRKQGLHVVAGLSKELGNVKKAAAMDSDVLSSYVSKLEMGLDKVRSVLHYEKPSTRAKFFESMNMFLKQAEGDIVIIKDENQKALSSVKEVTEYFHGNAAKEESHPFRIFMIVRDFLSILDNVCKEVGRLQDRSMVMGTVGSFRKPATASLPVLSGYSGRQDRSSDDDNLSS